MKFPSAFAGALAPSGSSVAATKPGVWGSRVGGVGRGGGADIDDVWQIARDEQQSRSEQSRLDKHVGRVTQRSYYFQGNAKATYSPPEGHLGSRPPPAAITMYCLPSIM